VRGVIGALAVRWTAHAVPPIKERLSGAAAASSPPWQHQTDACTAAQERRRRQPHLHAARRADQRHAALLERLGLLVPADRHPVLAHARGLQRVAGARVAFGQALSVGGRFGAAGWWWRARCGWQGLGGVRVGGVGAASKHACCLHVHVGVLCMTLNRCTLPQHTQHATNPTNQPTNLQAFSILNPERSVASRIQQQAGAASSGQAPDKVDGQLPAAGVAFVARLTGQSRVRGCKLEDSCALACN